MNKFLIIVFLFLGLGQLSAQQINWVTWEEAVELNKNEPRKLFVDVYTEWCTYCKKLDGSTLSDPMIVDYINDNYYAIKFDAEHKSDITVNGHTYKYIASSKRGYHELAKEILNGQMSYPTLVFLDEGITSLQAIKGFQDVRTLIQILHFFGGDHHKSTPWIQFTKSFNSSIIGSPTRSVPVKSN